MNEKKQQRIDKKRSQYTKKENEKDNKPEKSK